MEFTIYEVKEGNNDTKSYIKKEDAERVFNEILSVDLEKYAFYMIYTTFNTKIEDATITNQR